MDQFGQLLSFAGRDRLLQVFEQRAKAFGKQRVRREGIEGKEEGKNSIESRHIFTLKIRHLA